MEQESLVRPAELPRHLRDVSARAPVCIARLTIRFTALESQTSDYNFPFTTLWQSSNHSIVSQEGTARRVLITVTGLHC